jgi:hypothetical protein
VAPSLGGDGGDLYVVVVEHFRHTPSVPC